MRAVNVLMGAYCASFFIGLLIGMLISFVQRLIKGILSPYE